MKIEVNPFRRNNFSKNRNSKSKTLILVDSSGQTINGDIKKHYNNVASKIQDRYNNISLKLKELTEEELLSVYNNPKNNIYVGISSSTDKSALVDTVWTLYFEKAKDKSEDELLTEFKSIEEDSDLNKLRKNALEKAYELSKQKKKENE